MTSVLYDSPGPRTKRRTLLASVLAGIVLIAVVAVIVIRLADQDQFSAERWGPLLDPTDPRFPQVWARLGSALIATLSAAGLTLVFALAIGTLLAVVRVTSAPWYRWLVVSVIEVFRGLPVVITILLAYTVLRLLGLNVSLVWYVVVGLTAYNAVIIAEIVRAGIASLPRGQAEAAYSVGMTRGQVLRLVQLPQAFRIMLPALISQLVVIVKDTSLGFIISYEEFVRTANQIIQLLNNPIQLYAVVAAIFIAINFSLGKLAEYVERRLSRARKTAAAPADPTLVDTGATGGG